MYRTGHTHRAYRSVTVAAASAAARAAGKRLLRPADAMTVARVPEANVRLASIHGARPRLPVGDDTRSNLLMRTRSPCSVNVSCVKIVSATTPRSRLLVGQAGTWMQYA